MPFPERTHGGGSQGELEAAVKTEGNASHLGNSREGGMRLYSFWTEARALPISCICDPSLDPWESLGPLSDSVALDGLSGSHCIIYSFA